jgi:transketolase
MMDSFNEADLAKAPFRPDSGPGPGSEPGRSEDLARLARRSTVSAIHGAGGGHFGGSLSIVDILAVLFHDFIFRDRSAAAVDRDRFILSKGHAAAAYYATLAELGLIPRSRLATFAAAPGELQGHPDMLSDPIIDFSTGSLGQGLSVAAGMAMMLRPQGRHVWALVGDGECQEGQIWEAAMLTARLGLGNVTVIVDANGHQEWGYRPGGIPEIPVLDLPAKWSAFGWNVVECDGHDHSSLRQALSAADAGGRPKAIIARTVKGFGSALIEEDSARFHCGELNDDEIGLVLEALG